MSDKRNRKGKKPEPEVVGFLGIGLDDAEGHRRITTGDHFVLVGGSESTHDRMIDTAVQVSEELHRQGKQLADATPEELRDLFRDAIDRRGS